MKSWGPLGVQGIEEKRNLPLGGELRGHPEGVFCRSGGGPQITMQQRLTPDSNCKPIVFELIPISAHGDRYQDAEFPGELLPRVEIGFSRVRTLCKNLSQIQAVHRSRCTHVDLLRTAQWKNV